jgi:hypothetical protein
MVHPSDIDSQLEEEIREEMKKYGKLTNVIVHQVCHLYFSTSSIYLILFYLDAE